METKYLDYPDAHRASLRGYGLARIGWKSRGPKWIRHVPASPGRLEHFELVYHASYPNHFAGRSSPGWRPGNCDLFTADWYIHPLAPKPDESLPEESQKEPKSSS